MYSNNTLENSIEQFGKTDIVPIVKQIKNYEDLAIFYKAFINGRLYRSINYFGQFGNSGDSFGHGKESNSLSEIHNYGIVSFDGQCNLIEQYYRQRGFLEFVAKNDIANKLIPRLLKDSRIYTVFKKSEKTFHNAQNVIDMSDPKEDWGINVTLELDEDDITWNPITFCMIYDSWTDLDYPDLPYTSHLKELLTDCTNIFIICKNFGDSINCSDILLQHIKDANINKII